MFPISLTLVRPTVRLESLVCPHFASSFEWFPATNLTHVHTLHLNNNFLHYLKMDKLVTHLRGSAVTSLDLGQHCMRAPETLAIVEDLTSPNGANQLETLRLDMSKFSDRHEPAFLGFSGVLHLATNVRL